MYQIIPEQTIFESREINWKKGVGNPTTDSIRTVYYQQVVFVDNTGMSQKFKKSDMTIQKYMDTN